MSLTPHYHVHQQHRRFLGTNEVAASARRRKGFWEDEVEESTATKLEQEETNISIHALFKVVDSKEEEEDSTKPSKTKRRTKERRANQPATTQEMQGGLAKPPRACSPGKAHSTNELSVECTKEWGTASPMNSTQTETKATQEIEVERSPPLPKQERRSKKPLPK